ncbi:holo-ACP synthase [Borreliella americana]|uniref:holo-ACP synthase n=1 Tax=Borreliella americana TaxID=478807 RepID=UPI001E53D382|nr:4'-phosphopantetheinyl transferase superfamily protein [Borreliella americana]MCD2332527.1 4'-phosphopantetheinyl transferase superfamily protein [Borreliella americana]
MKSIGCDIIKVERFKNFLENKKKMERFFTHNEIENFKLKGGSIIESLAGKFAAKESLIKALSPLLQYKINYTLKDIEVIKSLKGNVGFCLHNEVEKFAIKMNLKLYLTISHEKEYAIAFAIVEN